ncbi:MULTISPECIES: hypothetical protein [Spiribacter]|uniref:hypothetical protein n=1 Tax=Spiribacter TaxID=1335745 RepID=UPI001330B56A|nr:MULTISPECIES: hypothetical protein [Spiribacter]KAF0284111.1 hypothetical protein BA898_07035 [Spiribacter roseus]KAF0285496.1 hypothetical protein BA899_00460 [Spiribacter sp. SSL99]
MVYAYLSILGMALTLGVMGHRHSAVSHVSVIRGAWRQLAPLLIRLPIALIAASLVGELIPQALFGEWLGARSGLTGVVIASALGGILPGGPTVTFPLILVLERAGVGTPQLIALLTGWSCFALHRVLAYELPTLGWAFVWRRWLVSMVLGPLAGALALSWLG